MATVPELSSGKVYIGPEPRQDRSIKSIESGGKQFDGTLAVTGPAFIGGHSASAKGVLNVGTDLGDFKPRVAGRALDVEGDVNVKGDATLDGDIQQTGNINQTGRFTTTGKVTCGSLSSGLPKSFDIEHPTKGKGWRLRYACIEGPEAGVYYRGRLKNQKVIRLPYYWKDLVSVDSITVQLQPIGAHQDIIVKRWDDENIYLQAQGGLPINCFYHVYAERNDIDKLEVEYEG